MAGSEVERVSARPANATIAKIAVHRTALLLALIPALALLVYFFPLFHIVPLQTPAGTVAAGATFDPAVRAAQIWKSDLLPAAARATELTALLPALRANAEAAKTTFSKSAGVGANYYFVRGSGRVVARERSSLRIAVDGSENEIITLRIGPIFGNAVRDGSGLLDVNAFPGLQEFNALSAELNALVEKTILPSLREKATEGARVQFAGCAEAPENAADAGEPMLAIIPVLVEVR